MMAQVIDRFLPLGMTWRDLFDVSIVSARKPAFFSQSMPLYEIVTEDGMMREKFRMKEGRIYSGGSAAMVEKLFKCESDDVMYIGDHIFTDVNLAKANMRWRTALIVREIEEEVVAMDRGRLHTQELHGLIKKKEKCGNTRRKKSAEISSTTFGQNWIATAPTAGTRITCSLTKKRNNSCTTLWGGFCLPWWSTTTR